ncbi:MAG: hypothetical protein AAB588_00870 [Patescibacteria group bacterium]
MIDPLDPQFAGAQLGKVVKPVMDGSVKPTEATQYPPYEALLVHEDMASRRELLTRLLDMFATSSAAVFAPEDLHAMRTSLELAAVDPEKDPQNFAYFMQDRCHGMLEMLRLLILMQSPKRNFSKQEVFNEAMRLGAQVMSENGMPQAVLQFVGAARDRAMHPRVERLRKVLEIGPMTQYVNFNNVKLAEVKVKFSSLSGELDKILAAFKTQMEQLQTSLVALEYTSAQWLSVLLTKLEKFQPQTLEEARAQFERLTEAINRVSTPSAMTKTIETLGNPAE